MRPASPAPAPNPSYRAPSSEPRYDEIDLQELAQRVFALMKQELRIERERLGRDR